MGLCVKVLQELFHKVVADNAVCVCVKEWCVRKLQWTMLFCVCLTMLHMKELCVTMLCHVCVCVSVVYGRVVGVTRLAFTTRVPWMAHRSTARHEMPHLPVTSPNPTPATCSTKTIRPSPKATLEHKAAQSPSDQARRQSQRSAASATDVPSLPHEGNVNV